MRGESEPATHRIQQMDEVKKTISFERYGVRRVVVVVEDSKYTWRDSLRPAKITSSWTKKEMYCACSEGDDVNDLKISQSGRG